MKNIINTISFSLQIKEEIIQKKFKKCCKKNLLSAIIKNNYQWVNDEYIFISVTSKLVNDYVIKFIISLFPQIKIQTRIIKRNKYYSYIINIYNFEDLFDELYINNKTKFLYQITKNNVHCKRAYVAGLFINSGSVNPPETPIYHLEINLKNNEYEIKNFNKLMLEFNFEFKKIIRAKNVILYIKKSELISDFLKFIDASNSVLNFENQRIERDFINNINRLNNIDVSNAQKIIKASEKQILMIQFLINNSLFDELDDKIKKLAKLRLQYPESSLHELSKYMKKEFNIIISKPGVNHLFRKINIIYKKNV